MEKSIYNHRVSFLNTKFFYIVFINSIFYYLITIHHQMPSLQGFKSLISLCVFNFAFFYVLCFLAFKTHQKLLIWLQNFLVFVGMLSGCISIFLILHFNSLLNSALVGIILASNPNEIQEFIQFYLDIKTFITILTFLIGSFLITFYKKSFPLNTKITISLFIGSILVLLVQTYRACQYHSSVITNKNEFLRTFDVIYNAVLEKSSIIAQYKDLDATLKNTYNKLLSTRGGGNSF